MRFKDRAEAANKLIPLLRKNNLKENTTIIVSLLRGGAVLGDIIAKKLQISHLPLSVVKISSPTSKELAIGALCFDITYLEAESIDMMKISKKEISEQINIAEEKFISYCLKFEIDESLYEILKNKTVIIVDDGIATGATVKAAVLFAKTKSAKKIIIASPVIAADFNLPKEIKIITLLKDPQLHAVSQYYKNFEEVSDERVMDILKK